ncbi:polymer-forming cytoskeletal protein [Erythrobacter alti]|uniref:bactofilin family protein n=1 Tax=Erythrobacter alti TaxID=1896145 RepID=UPI0030F454D9
MANGGSTFSVIGPDVTIRGNIEATVDLHVDGRVIGDITCASLVQGESSRIEGEVKAESARLSGEVSGKIEARDLVVLKSAKIDGDVSYETLTIEQGANVDGRFAPLGAKKQKAAGQPATETKGPAEPTMSLAG